MISITQKMARWILANCAELVGGLGSVLILALMAGAVQAAPIFLGVAVTDSESKTQNVLAGRKTEFILTLTSLAAEIPELKAELSAIAGGLSASIFSNQTLQIHRVGEVRTGVQRFKFEVEIPVAEKKQALLLRLKVRPAATESWLPLPTVMLEARPQTWKTFLQNFTRQVPSGRLAGCNHLEQLFRQAEIATAETPADEPVADQTIRVWFVEADGDAFHPPAAPHAIWVVFKKDALGGPELWRPSPQALPCVVVDANILLGLDSDPAAQEVFERALAMAQTLVLPSSLTLSQPSP